MKIKELKFKWQKNHIMKKVLKTPPKGQEIKEYTFKGLTNDILFVLNVELSAHDIGLLTSDKANTFGTYLISEFEKAQKRLEEERKYEEVNAKYFKQFLESKGLYWSNDIVKQIVQGCYPFEALENDLYREYQGTEFGRKAHLEIGV